VATKGGRNRARRGSEWGVWWGECVWRGVWGCEKNGGVGRRRVVWLVERGVVVHGAAGKMCGRDEWKGKRREIDIKGVGGAGGVGVWEGGSESAKRQWGGGEWMVSWVITNWEGEGRDKEVWTKGVGVGEGQWVGWRTRRRRESGGGRKEAGEKGGRGGGEGGERE